MQQIRETTRGACTPIYCWSRKGVGSMEHSEALKEMTAERYLLDELTPEVREEFEQHMFDCQECAFDIRAGAAFVDEAKTQLPELTRNSPALHAPVAGKGGAERVEVEFLVAACLCGAGICGAAGGDCIPELCDNPDSAH